ncbi:MAG TPA: PQQ-dependent sugar dehydrogenase [Woeseiaceae bacterium]|nr:PQQ-dependent sugar dehydrogenase [Woeseiaceae bacterium]
MTILGFLTFTLQICVARADVDLDEISLPPGFSIEVFAEVKNARSLALGDNGVVYVSTRSAGSVYAVVPTAGENRVVEIDKKLKSPNGIAYHDGDLYVAEISRVLLYRNIGATYARSPQPEVLDISLPSEGHHGWRYIGFGPDNKLYIAIGAPCNICDREGFAKIVRMNSDGSEREIVARGVRNSVGFTWCPGTGELWFTDNGRDMMGDDLPADELNRVTEVGQHFGFPYCHAGSVPDPKFGDGRNCADYRAPAQKLGAHVAALGLKFYTGEMFPAAYRGQLFIAEHGSWNSSKKVGYRVSLVQLVNGNAVSYTPFAEGWVKGQETRGRPVDLLVYDDGSLLVSDDYSGKVYRVRYDEPGSDH